MAGMLNMVVVVTMMRANMVAVPMRMIVYRFR